MKKLIAAAACAALAFASVGCSKKDAAKKGGAAADAGLQTLIEAAKAEGYSPEEGHTFEQSLHGHLEKADFRHYGLSAPVQPEEKLQNEIEKSHD